MFIIITTEQLMFKRMLKIEYIKNQYIDLMKNLECNNIDNRYYWYIYRRLILFKTGNQWPVGCYLLMGIVWEI